MSADIMKEGNAAPFHFDVNFAAPVAAKPIPTVSLADHETALREAEERGRQAGLAEGRAGEEARLANEAARIAKAAESILTAIDLDRRKLERDSATLALSIGRTLAGEAVKQFPLSEIEALITECLGPLRDTPHLVVRLNEKDADAITETVGKFAREAGFEGRFVVLGEPDFAPGDCRIEWADGGIVRNHSQAKADIETAFNRYFSALAKEPGEPETKDQPVKEPLTHE